MVDNFQSRFYPSLDFRATHSKAFVKVLVMLDRGCLINHRTSPDLPRPQEQWILNTHHPSNHTQQPEGSFWRLPCGSLRGASHLALEIFCAWLWKQPLWHFSNMNHNSAMVVTDRNLKWLKEDPIFPDKPWMTTKTPSLVETLPQSMNHTYFSGVPSLLHASCGYWHWQKHWEHPEALNASMESKSPQSWIRMVGPKFAS